MNRVEKAIWSKHALERWGERVPVEFLDRNIEVKKARYATGTELKRLRSAYKNYMALIAQNPGLQNGESVFYFATDTGIIFVCAHEDGTDVVKNIFYLTPKIFYHGTSEEAWQKIQEEGVLLGVRDQGNGKRLSRLTYLTQFKEEAECYGPVLLEVRYVPSKKFDNYVSGCWQLRTHRQVSVEKNVKRIK